MANKTRNTNVNKLVNNPRKVYANIEITAITSIIVTTNIATSNAKITNANVTASSNNNSTKRACINKAIIVNRSNDKRARANIAATANAIVMAKKKANARKPVTNKELEIIVRKFVIYGNNKKNIGLTKSFKRSA